MKKKMIMLSVVAFAGLSIAAQAEEMNWDSGTDPVAQIQTLLKNSKSISSHGQSVPLPPGLSAQAIVAQAIDGKDVLHYPDSPFDQLSWKLMTVNGKTQVEVSYNNADPCGIGNTCDIDDSDGVGMGSYYATYYDNLQFVFPQLTLAGDKIMDGDHVVARLTHHSIWKQVIGVNDLGLSKGYVLHLKRFTTKL